MLISVSVLFACAGDSDNGSFIDGVLLEHATHLAGGDRREIARALIRVERAAGVDALLLLAMMEEESDYRLRAKSRRGALGLLQVRPLTGRDVAGRHQIPWDGEDSLFDPTVNILIAGRYLSELKSRFGSWDLALTAYNQGPTKTNKTAKRGRTPSSGYSARVLRRFEALRKQSTH